MALDVWLSEDYWFFRIMTCNSNARAKEYPHCFHPLLGFNLLFGIGIIPDQIGSFLSDPSSLGMPVRIRADASDISKDKSVVLFRLASPLFNCKLVRPLQGRSD
jgi:hypothetical protein